MPPRAGRPSVANLGADGELERALAAMGAEPEPEPQRGWDDAALPAPVLLHTLGFLGSPLGLCRARQVSRSWRDAASCDELWRAVYLRSNSDTGTGSAGRRRSDDETGPAAVAGSPGPEGGWRRRLALAAALGRPNAISIQPVWGGLDGRLFGAPRSGHAAAVFSPTVGGPGKHTGTPAATQFPGCI